MKTKICLICGNNLIKNNNKSNFQKYCLECSKIVSKKLKKKDDAKYYETHKEEHYKQHIIWKEKNREHYLEMGRKYYQLHKLEDSIRCKEYRKIHREQLNKYHREWKKKHPDSYLIDRLRKRIWDALKFNYKSTHTMELIGCSIEYLKQHLETHFQAGMSWKNYGEWHIDHIKPCAKFDLNKPEEQKICFNYKNLQPLWAKDNIIKSDNY